MEAKAFGREVAKGILSELGKHLFFWLGVIGLITVALSYIIPKDNTDPPGGRSGLKLYTDNLTGVQYVGTKNGLTVRVDVDGRPIIVGRK